jgi:DNA repair protein RecO (recombination protein O)
MLRRTEGIVLRTFPFGEADLIVTYLTSDSGLVRAFAKSCRKIKSRFGSSLEPLTLSKIALLGKENAALPKLTQSDIIRPFQSLREKLHCYFKLSEIVELTVSFVPENDANRKIYFLLLFTLTELANSTGQEDLLVNNYKVKFLRLAGFAPRLDRCGRCGDEGLTFHVSQGSILCDACSRTSGMNTPATETPLKLSPAVGRFYMDLLDWDNQKITRIKPAPSLLSELSGLIDYHIRFILDRPLKSKSFSDYYPK